MHDKIFNKINKKTTFKSMTFEEINNTNDPFSSTKDCKQIRSLSLKKKNSSDEQNVNNNASTQTNAQPEIRDHSCSQTLDAFSIDFQVRWADGDEGNNEDSISPVASNISRRINRSKRNVLKKKSNSFMGEIFNEPKDDDGNLMRYIEYAKNLLGITPTQRIKDSVAEEEENVGFKNGTDSGIGCSSVSDDDLFDDSVDDLMIQCSQAVEDSLDLIGNKQAIKHFVTPENNSLMKKRQKCDKIELHEKPKENKPDEPQGHIKSLLDDGIELFDSMDFAYIDSLSTADNVVKASDNEKPQEIKTTYSQREMIEKRKNEARRKLLFKMKSM